MIGTLAMIVLLLLATMALIVIEIYTPFFGLLAAMSVASTGAAIYLAWNIHQLFGLVVGAACLIGLPIYIVAAVKYIPNTKMGRKLHLGKDLTPPGEATPEAESLSRLVGRQTTAETPLRPSGAISIDGRRIVAQAESGMIGKGEQVRVVRAEGNRVVVQRVPQQRA